MPRLDRCKRRRRERTQPAWCCCRQCGSYAYRLGINGSGCYVAICPRGHASTHYYARLQRAGLVAQGRRT